MKKILVSFLLGFSLLATTYAHAGLSCSVWNGTPYCTYNGKIQQVYVNRGGTLLLYTSEVMDLTKATAVGITGITRNNAFALNMNDYPEFAKQLLTLGLSAQMSGASVTLQVMGVPNNYAGYLSPDRIWKK